MDGGVGTEKPHYYDSVVERYNSGDMIKNIASDLGMRDQLLSYHMRRCGFKFDRRYNSLSNLQVEQLINRYENGESTNSICKDMPCSPDTALKVLKDNGVRIKTKRELKFYRGYTINENAFEDIQQECPAYFYGWILTDGCLSKECVSLGLSSKDDEVLENLKVYMGSSNKIYYRSRRDKRTEKTYHAAEFSFSHAPIVERLRKLGLSERKSMNEVCPPELEKNRHFWRGVVEGDGHIPKDRHGIEVCGSKELVEKFSEYCLSVCPKTTISYRNVKGLYTVRVGRKGSVKEILDSLYEGSTVKLTRKYNAYTEKYYG